MRLKLYDTLSSRDSYLYNDELPQGMDFNLASPEINHGMYTQYGEYM
jgi:hypothetical protein